MLLWPWGRTPQVPWRPAGLGYAGETRCFAQTLPRPVLEADAETGDSASESGSKSAWEGDPEAPEGHFRQRRPLCGGLAAPVWPRCILGSGRPMRAVDKADSPLLAPGPGLCVLTPWRVPVWSSWLGEEGSRGKARCKHLF